MNSAICWERWHDFTLSGTRTSSDLAGNTSQIQIELLSHLPQEEHKVSDSIDCGDAQSVFHQDHEGVTCRRAETGAVDGCGCICILGNKNTGEAVTMNRRRRRVKEVKCFVCYLIEIVEALLQTPQTADTSFQQTASACVLLRHNDIIRWSIDQLSNQQHQVLQVIQVSQTQTGEETPALVIKGVEHFTGEKWTCQVSKTGNI